MKADKRLPRISGSRISAWARWKKVGGEGSDVLLASNLAIVPSLTQMSRNPLMVLYLGSLKLRDGKNSGGGYSRNCLEG